ncbi:MAG: DUF2336 domain-containing protein [Alphaproteobacteria bacterium]|nr:DUF2336 domain-containing protein [Alphaproteobacteria bacterium]
MTMTNGSNATSGGLSDLDVKRLFEDPSPEAHAETAVKIAGKFDSHSLTEDERKIAEDIFRVMAGDVEERVREALSKSLNDIPDLPGDIAKSLAQDISDAVAFPILTNSRALSDEDLTEIIATQGASKQVAIAQREVVSAAVSEALVDSGNEDAVVALVGNEGAELTETTLEKVVENYGDSERVQDPLVHREKLPITVAERLVAKLTDELKDHLVGHHELSPEVASDLVLQSRERATIGLLSAGQDEPNVEDMVRQMDRNGRLTTSIILRALCTGDLTFFEASLAVKADVPLVNARILVHDDNDLALRSLYTKAEMPERYYPAFLAAIDIAKETEFERSDSDPDWRHRLILERMLTQFEEPDDEFDVEDIDYLLNRLSRIEAQATTQVDETAAE